MLNRSLGLLAWSLLVSAAPAAPVAKDKPAETLYFPTTVGTKWVYEKSDKSEAVEVITATKQKDEATLVSVGWERRGEVQPMLEVEVSEKGLAVRKTLVADLSEPLWLLRLPHTAGNKWGPVMAGEPWGRVVGKASSSGPERVEVPAGVYQAIRVDTEMPHIDGREGVTKSTTWYAPGVGVVKQARGDQVRVLKSFTLGKK